MENRTGHQTDDEDGSDTENSDYPSDDQESVDILNISPSRITRENVPRETSVSANKFSIDRILGIKSDDELYKKDDNYLNRNNSECERERDPQFVKPTPIQATPQNGNYYYFENFQLKSLFDFRNFN